MTLITEALPEYRTTGAGLFLPFFLAFLAHGYGQLQQLEKSFATVAEALHLTATTLDAFWAAELYRLKGELTLQKVQVPGSKFQVADSPASRVKTRAKFKGQRSKPKLANPQSAIANPQSEAEACFHKAREIARRQEAKSLELRAAMSLSRLWQHQGKRDEARTLLAETYTWFTEGFDTQDLRDAKALLVQLS